MPRQPSVKLTTEDLRAASKTRAATAAENTAVASAASKNYFIDAKMAEKAGFDSISNTSDASTAVKTAEKRDAPHQ